MSSTWITEQANKALNDYAARAGVSADQIPALTFEDLPIRTIIHTPGARVAAEIAKAVSSKYVSAKASGATVYCQDDAQRATASQERREVRAQRDVMPADEADAAEWLGRIMSRGEDI